LLFFTNLIGYNTLTIQIVNASKTID